MDCARTVSVMGRCFPRLEATGYLDLVLLRVGFVETNRRVEFSVLTKLLEVTGHDFGLLAKSLKHFENFLEETSFVRVCPAQLVGSKVLVDPYIAAMLAVDPDHHGCHHEGTESVV